MFSFQRGVTKSSKCFLSDGKCGLRCQAAVRRGLRVALTATVPPPELTSALTTQGKERLCLKLRKGGKKGIRHQMLDQFRLDQNPIKCSSYNIFIANWFDC